MCIRDTSRAMCAALVLTSLSATTYAQLEEVIVTAQKRAESAQDVPIAVTAFDAESLEAKQMSSFQDIRFAAPNVTVSKGNFTATNFQIFQDSSGFLEKELHFLSLDLSRSLISLRAKKKKKKHERKVNCVQTQAVQPGRFDWAVLFDEPSLHKDWD